MKKIRLLAVYAAIPLFGLMFSGCIEDLKLPEIQSVRASGVELDPTLASGMDMFEGEILDISGKFTVTPAGATNLTASYSSSDASVAVVSAVGVISALVEGVATISIMVDTKLESFTLTVRAIPVDYVEFDADLKDGQLLGRGQTLNLANKVTITPSNATDKTMHFASSDENVATVSTAGVVTAITEGVTTISVTVGGKTDSFVLTVTRSVTLSISSVTIPVTATNRIWDKIDVLPAPLDLKNKNVNFTSSNTTVATVDEHGVIWGKAAGTATITVADKTDPNVKATLPVTVVTVNYYPRRPQEATGTTLWTMTSTPVGTTLTGPFDGVWGTTNADVAANFLSIPRSNVSATNPMEFVVDMKVSQVVNVFKIIHRSGPNTNRLVRFFGFDRIEGSSNGTTFTLIDTMVEVADAQSPLITAISETVFENSTAYRYIKFRAETPAFCFIHGMANYPGISQLLDDNRNPSTVYNSGNIQNHTDNQGGSNQIQELYLGRIQ